MTHNKCCTHDCRQRRDCPHRFVEPNGALRIMFWSIVLSASVLGGVIWGLVT